MIVGFNLRTHDLVKQLKKKVEQEKVLHASMMIHRYLPTMRKGQDYENSYSCHVSQGGGVTKDFSHELDLGLWLFGACQRLVAHGGKSARFLETLMIRSVFCWNTKGFHP